MQGHSYYEKSQYNTVNDHQRETNMYQRRQYEPYESQYKGYQPQNNASKVTNYRD